MASTALLESDQENGVLDDPVCRFEIVDGVQVEVPPMSIYSERVATNLLAAIFGYLAKNAIGIAEYEALYRLPIPEDRNRRPDVSFVSYDRWPKDRPVPYRGNARDVVPDLAVEVVSPNDLVEELTTKIDEFFRARVRLLWVVHCNLRQVYVYRSSTSIEVLTDADELKGDDVLPGFQVAIASLFPPVVPPEPPVADH
jgi:Uma2 family endonuclease